MALVTLQTIFQDAYPAYEQTHLLPAHVRRGGTHHHTVPDRSPRGPHPSLPGRPHRACLVQFVPPPVMSAMCVSPDGAVAGPPAGPALGL